MTAPSHQALYRSSPLVFGGLLGAIVLAVAGGAAGLQIVPRDQRLALVVACWACSWWFSRHAPWRRCAGIAGRSMPMPW